ncbi:MAG: hypothetical protein FWD01_01845 [Defluviitaleaceae bacterium]|nr:hypothetical protein [Defluviitaleaceae bacterium]
MAARFRSAVMDCRASLAMTGRVGVFRFWGCMRGFWSFRVMATRFARNDGAYCGFWFFGYAFAVVL